MKTELKHLLDTLDTIAAEHDEVTDTDVREQMYEAVYRGFIIQQPGYVVPSKFGMFTPAGDELVHRALAEFIPVACAAGPSVPQRRFEAFQDDSVVSGEDHAYDWFFGYSESLEQLTAAYGGPHTA